MKSRDVVSVKADPSLATFGRSILSVEVTTEISIMVWVSRNLAIATIKEGLEVTPV